MLGNLAETCEVEVELWIGLTSATTITVAQPQLQLHSGEDRAPTNHQDTPSRLEYLSDHDHDVVGSVTRLGRGLVYIRASVF